MTDPWVGHFDGSRVSGSDILLSDTDRRAFFYWNEVPIEGDFGDDFEILRISNPRLWALECVVQPLAEYA